MKVMILAAGEGRRMRPLTLHTPKPLLKVAGVSLIEHHLMRLKEAGFNDVLINVAYLGQKIVDEIGDGTEFGMEIDYSFEPEPLETGGALYAALPFLGEETFLLLNADIWIDFPLQNLAERSLSDEEECHLVLVDNPPHHPTGDFSLDGEKLIPKKEMAFTYSGLALIKPCFISEYPECRDKFPLKEVFEWGMDRGVVTGEHYSGFWNDIGSPERLEDLEKKLKG